MVIRRNGLSFKLMYFFTAPKKQPKKGESADGCKFWMVPMAFILVAFVSILSWAFILLLWTYWILVGWWSPLAFAERSVLIKRDRKDIRRMYKVAKHLLILFPRALAVATSWNVKEQVIESWPKINGMRIMPIVVLAGAMIITLFAWTINPFLANMALVLSDPAKVEALSMSGGVILLGALVLALLYGAKRFSKTEFGQVAIASTKGWFGRFCPQIDVV